MYNKSTIKLFSLILYYESNASFHSMHIVKKEDKCKIFMMMCMDCDMNVCEQKVSSWIRVIEIFAIRLSYSFSVMFNWAPNKA